MAAVLDTSTVLAWLRGEPGSDIVDPLLPEAVMSTVNWAELAQKLLQHGVDARQATSRLRALGITVETFTPRDALMAAELWSKTRKAGLSLGDRACLALAERLGMSVVTADKAWMTFDFGFRVQLIR